MAAFEPVGTSKRSKELNKSNLCMAIDSKSRRPLIPRHCRRAKALPPRASSEFRAARMSCAMPPRPQ